jgi:hypothetical protein
MFFVDFYFLKFLLAQLYVNLQNTEISFWFVNFNDKIYQILYPQVRNSI